MIQRLVDNAGFPDHFLIQQNFDIIYVPSSIAPEMIKVLSHIVQTADLFCGNAGPLAVGIVRPVSEIVEIDRCGFLWREDRKLPLMIEKSKTCPLVHPFKLSNKDHAAIWKVLMDRLLLKCKP